jgi:tetratricopeptide (TPR) repeat protein
MQRVRTFQAQNPKSPVGFVREAEVLIAQKQYAQAAKAYEQGFDRSNDLAVFAKMQTVLVGTGQQKLANQKLDALLTRYPKDLNIQAYAANYYLELGRNAESLRLHEGLQRVQPNNLAILNNLAVLYQRLKDGRALATAEQAYKLAPTNPGIMDTLGWILLEQGQTARAVDLLQQASAKAPKSPTLRYHLAAAYAKAGKRAEAKRELEVLLKSGGKFPELEEARKLATSL